MHYCIFAWSSVAAPSLLQVLCRAPLPHAQLTLKLFQQRGNGLQSLVHQAVFQGHQLLAWPIAAGMEYVLYGYCSEGGALPAQRVGLPARARWAVEHGRLPGAGRGVIRVCALAQQVQEAVRNGAVALYQTTGRRQLPAAGGVAVSGVRSLAQLQRWGVRLNRVAGHWPAAALLTWLGPQCRCSDLQALEQLVVNTARPVPR